MKKKIIEATLYGVVFWGAFFLLYNMYVANNMLLCIITIISLSNFVVLILDKNGIRENGIYVILWFVIGVLCTIFLWINVSLLIAISVFVAALILSIGKFLVTKMG